MAAATSKGAAIAECYWDGESVILDVKEQGRLAGGQPPGVSVAQEDDIALILHTSGTTGTPKAVRRKTLLQDSFHLNEASLNVIGASYSPQSGLVDW